MAPSIRLPSSRIPVPRFFTASATSSRCPPNASPSPSPATPNSPGPNFQHDTTCSPASDDEQKREAIALRATCSTPTFNQSTKFSSLVVSEGPANPFMQRGHGICTIPRYTDYKTALEDEGSPPTRGLNRKLSRMGLRTSEDDGSSSNPSPSSSLSRKASRFRLRLRPSKSSLRSSDGSSDGNSRCSSPATAVSSEKPLPLPPLFSPCTSPFDEYYDHTSVTEVPPPPASPQPRFKIRRKPVPEYIPEYLPQPPLPAVDVDSLSSSSSSAYSSETDNSADDCSSLQIVGPNVFIAYDDNASLSALATAFTHIIHLSTAKPTGRTILRTPRSDVTYDPETGVHTLYLPIPPPVIPPHIFSDFSAIDESHRDIRFTSLLHNKTWCKPVPESILLAEDPDSIALTLEEPLQCAVKEDLQCEVVHPLSHDDLVATQDFLAASGRVVSLPELAYFLSDGPSDAPPLGLQLIQIDTVLSFLRPHPFAPTTRRRVLLMTPRGQLALEGLALMACYLAQVSGCSVRFVLRKFERSVGTVSKPWRGLLGNDGVVATYLEDLLLA
ncbi:hypothetical protein C8R45DRAFT_1105317 [Mycena sanguinolenta]|nr:hypothetical protein C8R45DRAFT_1105317 [Mycena sanguinolenta]